MTDELKKDNFNVPSPLKLPSLKPSAPKVPSLAPKSVKNPIKQAEQISNPAAKDFAKKQAKMIVASNTNQLAFSKSEDEPHYHISIKGQHITNDPVPLSEINSKYGGIKQLEEKGHTLHPVVKEKLQTDQNGQWYLHSK